MPCQPSSRTRCKYLCWRRGRCQGERRAEGISKPNRDFSAGIYSPCLQARAAAVCGRSRLAARPGHLSGHMSAGRAGAQPSPVWCTPQRWGIPGSPTWPSPRHWAGLFPSARFPGLSWSLNKPKGGGSSLPSPELALIVLFNTAPAPQACFNPHYHGQKVICRSTPLLPGRQQSPGSRDKRHSFGSLQVSSPTP